MEEPSAAACMAMVDLRTQKKRRMLFFQATNKQISFPEGVDASHLQARGQHYTSKQTFVTIFFCFLCSSSMLTKKPDLRFNIPNRTIYVNSLGCWPKCFVWCVRSMWISPTWIDLPRLIIQPPPTPCQIPLGTLRSGCQTCVPKHKTLSHGTFLKFGHPARPSLWEPDRLVLLHPWTATGMMLKNSFMSNHEWHLKTVGRVFTHYSV